MKESPRTKKRRRIGAILGHMYHRAIGRNHAHDLMDRMLERIQKDIFPGEGCLTESQTRSILWELRSLYLRGWDHGQREAITLVKKEGRL